MPAAAALRFNQKDTYTTDCHRIDRTPKELPWEGHLPRGEEELTEDKSSPDFFGSHFSSRQIFRQDSLTARQFSACPPTPSARRPSVVSPYC